MAWPNRYLLVFFLALMTTLPYINRGFFETSEGRFAMVAKSMNTTGDFWMPRLNGKEHLTKPPLTYWIIASGQKLFGMNTVGSRIFHTLLWCLLSLIIVRCGDLLWGSEEGLIGGLVFATSLLPALGSFSLTTDPILVFFQSLAFLSLLEYESKKNRIWIAAFWFSLGIAFNTKGPVSLIPFLFWIAFFPLEIKRFARSPLILIFLFTGTFWYLGLEYHRPGILSRLITDEIVKRSTTDFSGRNPTWWAPILVYFLPFLVGWGLWPMFVKKAEWRKLREEKRSKQLLLWMGMTLVVFSFIQSRLVLYILPLVIPGSLLLARGLASTKLLRPALLSNLFLIVAVKSFGTFGYRSDSDARVISEFAEEHCHDEQVYFLNEYLYGVEFYLGDKFRRFTSTNTALEALRKDPTIHCVVYQDKRKYLQSSSIFQEKLERKWKLGIWNVGRLNSAHELSSETALKNI